MKMPGNFIEEDLVSETSFLRLEAVSFYIVQKVKGHTDQERFIKSPRIKMDFLKV